MQITSKIAYTKKLSLSSHNFHQSKIVRLLSNYFVPQLSSNEDELEN